MMHPSKERSMDISRVHSLAGQIGIILLFADIFIVSARLSGLYYEWCEIFRQKLAVMMVAGLLLLFVIYNIWLITGIKGKLFRIKPVDTVIVLLLLLFRGLVGVSMLGYGTMGDGVVYYSQIYRLTANLDSNLETLLSYGKLGGHLSYGFDLFAVTSELWMPGEAMGFQWLHTFMGMGAAMCLYGIFKGFLPKGNKVISSIAALIVSVQPMFLGLSTSCSLESGIAVFFIYALYCYMSKSFVLMLFWVLVMATTKENGIMLALTFLGSIALYRLILYVRSKGIKKVFSKSNWKWLTAMGAILAAVIAGCICLIQIPVWGGVRLIDVINFGANEGSRMTFAFDSEHLSKKAAQMFVLNFNWIWVLLFAVSAVVYFVKRKKLSEYKFELGPVLVLTIPYVVHALFLMLYQEAKQPRYNMITDVLFAMIAILLFLRCVKLWRINTVVMVPVGALMFVETFATIDPLTTALFTNINTNECPLVFTWEFKWNTPLLDCNTGDTAFYNYQPTYMDRAIDTAIRGLEGQGIEIGDEITMVSSSFYDTEEQFLNENIFWDTKSKSRRYVVNQEPGRYVKVQRESAWNIIVNELFPETGILFELTTCKTDLEAAIEVLSGYYDLSGPYKADCGLAGSMTYYYITLKQE